MLFSIDSNVISVSSVTCNQCLRCQVSGHKISKNLTSIVDEIFAKVCFAQYSTSRLALGSRGCSLLVFTMPKISLKTLYCYIFEKPKVQGHQYWYSQLSNTQIHKYKYTNTALLKCQEYQTYAIFLNRCWIKDVKNDNPKCPKWSDPTSDQTSNPTFDPTSDPTSDPTINYWLQTFAV